MRRLAVFLTTLTAFVLIAFAYIFFSSRLSCAYSVKIAPAAAMEDLFYELKSDVQNGRYPGAPEIGALEDYSFVTLDLRAVSFSVFPAEWVTFSAVTQSGDVLIYRQTAGPSDISAFGSGKFEITLLTKNASATRSSILNYYVLGRNMSIYLSNSQEANQ